MDAYKTRDADFDNCAARVDALDRWRVSKGKPGVIAAPIPKSRPFNLFNRAKPKKVSS